MAVHVDRSAVGMFVCLNESFRAMLPSPPLDCPRAASAIQFFQVKKERFL